MRTGHLLIVQPHHPGTIRWTDRGRIRKLLFDSVQGKIIMRPLTAPLLAALTPSSFEVEFFDENIDSLERRAGSGSRPDLAAITVLTAAAPRAYAIADELRAAGVPVVLGGPHPTALPREALQHADAVVVGEADARVEDARGAGTIWASLLDDFRAGRMREFYQGAARADLDNVPFARREIVQRDSYTGPENIETSRGCPHHCEFCAANDVFGGYRFRPVDAVLAEMRDTLARYQNNTFFFTDNNLFGKPSRARELLLALRELRQQVPGFEWACQGDLNVTRHPDLLELASQAGCMGILIGFESLDAATIARIGKSGVNHTERYGDQIASIHRAGIPIIGGFVLGSDGDTESNFEAVCRFVEENNVDVPQITLSTPFPGTRLRTRLAAERRGTSTAWDLYTTCCGTFEPKPMSWTRMMRAFERAGARLYSRTAVATRVARAVRYLGAGGNRMHKLGMIYFSGEVYERLVSTGLELTRRRLGPWDDSATDRFRPVGLSVEVPKVEPEARPVDQVAATT